MKDSAYTTLFAAVLGVVCALLLTGASRVLGPYRDANAKAEEVYNVLHVLGVPVEEGTPAKDLVAAFEREVRVESRGELTLYRYVDPQDETRVISVAVPFSGPGLWGPIKGFLALEGDMRTIRGITFHEQEETPGLGGEIGSESFRGQFVGKSIESAAGQPGMHIVRGKDASSLGSNEVDAITGATMTCDKVEAMLNSVIAKILEESDRS